MLMSQCPAKYPETSDLVRWQWKSISSAALVERDTKNGCIFPKFENGTHSIKVLASLKPPKSNFTSHNDPSLTAWKFYSLSYCASRLSSAWAMSCFCYSQRLQLLKQISTVTKGFSAILWIGFYKQKIHVYCRILNLICTFIKTLMILYVKIK